MKKIFSSLIMVVLLFSTFTPVYLANSLETDLNYSDAIEQTGYSEAAYQLEQLYKLGYIDELVTEQDLKNDSQSQSLLADDSVNDEDILSEGAYIIGIDTNTDKVYDINDLIENEKENISVQSSLLVYSVAFKTWITDANTTTSRINHSVEVTNVWGIGTRPTNYTIIARVQRATSEFGSFSNAISQTKTVALKEIVNLSLGISSTYYWKTASEAWANYPDVSHRADGKDEGPWLLNKKGGQYPDYTDPKSKKVMSKPASTTWSAVSNPSCALTTSERTAYRNWYDSTYGALNWSNYEIHHIRPCKWGGNKEYSNLIPLPTDFHRGTVSPWWVNY